MKPSQDMLDLSFLPEHAKIQLFDFYDYLSKKYSISKKTEQPESGRNRFSKFLSEPVLVEKLDHYDREDLHDR